MRISVIAIVVPGRREAILMKQDAFDRKLIMNRNRRIIKKVRTSILSRVARHENMRDSIDS